jgi:magnesium-transporting ATPase (P-type)
MTYRSNIFKPHLTCIRNTFLRGCFLRNTDYIIGLVVYTGMETKIMKNLKKPLHKVSNIMRLMNNMLYSVFTF